ncbi:hypothetical protein CesoFtcFv8_009910 [Champsocephalus esox]|uniref:Uncharacterized protein n=1 Tax=Champsocephalus esox TaxID=159716 RepID=A0AAN8GZL3_9TELE|nr:hypothetical protein CesoFtcFv8_009910 [Champsocephalus esox]
MYLCTARETLSTDGEVASAVGRSVPSKILEWRRGWSLSQFAPLGRLDCNESRQPKRDLLATAREPALATCPVRGCRRTCSLQTHAECGRTVQVVSVGAVQ